MLASCQPPPIALTPGMMRGDFRGNAHFAAVVKHAHHIAVLNTALCRINRIEPHLLTTGGFQHIHVAVAGVGAP